MRLLYRIGWRARTYRLRKSDVGMEMTIKKPLSGLAPSLARCGTGLIMVCSQSSRYNQAYL